MTLKILCAGLCLLLCGPLRAQCLGMVSDLQGSVRVSGTHPLDLLDPLQQGQKLTLARGAVCTAVWYADGHRETVRGPAQVEFTAAGFKGGTVQKLPASMALKSLAPQSPPGPAYVTGVARFPSLPATPVSGVALLQGPPYFFETFPMATEVRLNDGEGKLLVSESLLLDGPWAIPASLSLQAGRIYRLVFLAVDGQELASRSFRVQAASSPMLQELLALAEIAPLDPAPWVARATLLSRDGSFDQALNAWQEALTRRPSPALLRRAAEACELLGYASQARCYRALAR